MADPLSVAASIAGLISITVEAGKSLRPYVSAARETPPIAAHVYSEVQSIEIILNGLQNVTSSLSSVHSRNATLIGVNQVITVLTDGVLLFSDLQDELRSLSPKNEDDGIPMRTRLRWVRKEGTLTALLTRLQGFKSSMTLVLMILKSDSDRSATQHHEQLSANINLLLESNQSLSRRLMNLEESMDTATIASRRMSFLTLVEDTSQGIASEQSHPSIAETDSTIGVSKFDFEDDLEASRAYRRAQRDTMDFSFRSSIARSNSWSVFSGLSLGDISIMAVIALPVYQEDLTNPEHYDFGNDTVVVAKEPEPTIERPLLVECLDIIYKMRQLPEMDEYFDACDGQEDTFNTLWSVLRHGYPLIILLKALDPRINIGEDKSIHFPIPLTRYNYSAALSSRKAAIASFVQYCREILEMETSSLFTVSDITGTSHHQFSKVISVVSLLIKRLTAAGIVSNSDSFAGYNRFELHDSTEVVNEFLSEQRHLVRQMTELANIRSQLEHEVIPRDGGVVVFGQVERLVELHIMMLIRMERNLFVLREDNRWHPAFGLYFEQIEPEALFVANEALARAKIRSWLDQDRFKDDERSITLFTQCLKIIPLLGQQVPRYESFLEYLDIQEKTNTEQTKDILMSKGSLHQAAARIGDAVKDEANREIVKDLNLCMDDWKGHVLAAFGDLTLFDFISITKNNNTKPYRGYLFQRIFIMCKEVKPDTPSRTGFFSRKKKTGPVLQHTKLLLKGRIFLHNITDIITGSDSGSYICRVVWKTSNDSDATESFTINFVKESQMILWSLKLNENRQRLAKLDMI
ncbi:hypothetical protein SNK05_003868 [Fusarium graminearum]